MNRQNECFSVAVSILNVCVYQKSIGSLCRHHCHSAPQCPFICLWIPFINDESLLTLITCKCDISAASGRQMPHISCRAVVLHKDCGSVNGQWKQLWPRPQENWWEGNPAVCTDEVPGSCLCKDGSGWAFSNLMWITIIGGLGKLTMLRTPKVRRAPWSK